MSTISVGEFPRNPTRMLREVRAGATYTITDRDEPVADVTAHRDQRWVQGAEIDALLCELGGSEGWAAELADQRRSEDASDPWQA